MFISLLLYLFIFILKLFVVSLMAPQASGQKRCQEVLDPNNCNLAPCKAQCLQKHNGSGTCTAKIGGTGFICNCFYNC